MPKLFKRLLKALGLAVATVVTAALVYVYTRPVPISRTNPPGDNAKRVRKLLNAKKVLFIGAHPDDIEFYAAGLVYMLRQKGADVTFAIATRGGKGRNGNSKTRLETKRSKDQLVSARILGGVKVVFYDYPDKDLPSHIDDFANDLVKIIHKIKPDIVLSWDPDYIYNPHPDHVAASLSARLALDTTGANWCYYGTREPNLWVGYGDDIFRIKVRALRAHRTETPWYFWIMGNRFVTRKSAGEGDKIGAHYAEVFRYHGT